MYTENTVKIVQNRTKMFESNAKLQIDQNDSHVYTPTNVNRIKLSKTKQNETKRKSNAKKKKKN